MNDNGGPDMAGEIMNLTAGEVAQVVNALVYIVICRFMAKRPDCWDTVSLRLQHWKKIIHPRGEIFRKMCAADKKTGTRAMPPDIEGDFDEVDNPFWIREI
jgi:hypothetical protein